MFFQDQGSSTIARGPCAKLGQVVVVIQNGNVAILGMSQPLIVIITGWLLEINPFSCHTAAIYLASRIWGLVRKTFSPYSPNHPPKILELPSHLSHIASSSPRVHVTLA